MHPHPPRPGYQPSLGARPRLASGPRARPVSDRPVARAAGRLEGLAPDRVVPASGGRGASGTPAGFELRKLIEREQGTRA